MSNISRPGDDDRPRILIADDDPEIRAVLFEFLSAGYTCAAVESAESALAILGEQKCRNSPRAEEQVRSRKDER